jgi:hypothetical protein
MNDRPSDWQPRNPQYFRTTKKTFESPMAAARASSPAVISPDRPAAAVGLAHKDPAIPSLYVKTILQGFGVDADLYQDVLQVPVNTESDRHLRIAYFKRGRQVLAEGGVRGSDEVASAAHVSSSIQTRFQAVSMAYEIVTNPVWKEYYRLYGLVATDEIEDMQQDEDEESSTEEIALPTPTQLAKSDARNSDTRNLAIRWNDNVEELVFDKGPNEYSDNDENDQEEGAKRRRRKRKDKKMKSKVVVEAASFDELELHLQTLDQEAEETFATGFLDTLEESMDDLLRLTGGADPEDDYKKAATSKLGQHVQSVKNSSSDREDAWVVADASGASDFVMSSKLEEQTRSHKSEPSRVASVKSEPSRAAVSENSYAFSLPGSFPDLLWGGSSVATDNNDEPKKQKVKPKKQPPKKQATRKDGSLQENRTEDMAFDEHSDHKNNGPQKSAAASKIAPDSQRSRGSKSATSSEKSTFQRTIPLPNNNEYPDWYIADETFAEAGTTILESEPAQNSTPEDLPFDMVQSVTPPVEHQEAQDAPLDEVPAAITPVPPTQAAVVESKTADDDDVFDGLEDEPCDESDWHTKTTIGAPMPQETRIRADISVASEEAMSDLSESVGTAGSSRRATGPTSLLDQLKKVHDEVDSNSLYEMFGIGSAVDQPIKTGAGGSLLSYSDGESMMETSVSFISEKLKLQNYTKSKSPETQQAGENSLTEAKQGQAVVSDSESFMDYYYAYISALVNDCAALGAKGLPSYNWEENQTTFLSSFVIDDRDMDSMLSVLEREIGRTPPTIEAIEGIRSEGIEIVRSFDDLRSDAVESVRSFG